MMVKDGRVGRDLDDNRGPGPRSFKTQSHHELIMQRGLIGFFWHEADDPETQIEAYPREPPFIFSSHLPRSTLLIDAPTRLLLAAYAYTGFLLAAYARWNDCLGGQFVH